MAKNMDKWIFSFAVTETQRRKDHTTYKITSIIIPKNTPEALSCITVVKRFREVKQLYKDIFKKARDVKINPDLVPDIKGTYFKRFEPEEIEERKNYIIKLLNFIGDHSVLFRSEAFVKFFEEQDNLSIDESITSDTSTTIGGVEDDSISIQSNNLETLLDGFTVEENPLNEITQKLFPNETPGPNAETDFLINQLTEEIDLDTKFEDDRISDIERRLKLLVDDASVDYLYEAALKFTEAVEAEAVGLYQKAFDCYKEGIDLLLSGVKNDTDIERKKIVREKVTKYLEKAEEIYENFILKQAEEDSLILLSSKTTEKSFEEITTNIERPLNYLSRFKVLKILDGLQQVQDVTDKKVYMVKVIQKPHSMHASRMIYLPQESLYMVPLVTYCQTNTSIFLILKLVSGGKLWDYIKSFSGQEELSPGIKQSENCLETMFVEPKNGKDISIKEKKPLILEVVPKIEIDEVDLALPDPPIELENSRIASFEALSSDMEVNELLDCSQKLLSAISSTLKRSKDTELSLEAKCVDKDELDSDLDEGSIEEILQEILEADISTINGAANTSPKEIQNVSSITDLNQLTQAIPSPLKMSPKRKHRLLPDATVRKYCAELICAIEDFHSHGIICGDLTLDNILLGPKGQLLLTYFYRNETRLTTPSKKAVKEYYVAPERPLSKISDSWSIGVIMFELLTEQRFCLCHPGSLDFFAEPQYDNVDISDDAQDLLMHLIEINPEERYTIKQIMEHSFFKSIDWSNLKNKSIIQY